MSRLTSIYILLLILFVSAVIFQTIFTKKVYIPEKVRLGRTALSEQNETDVKESELNASDGTLTSSLRESVFDVTTTIPDPENGLQVADRIWGKVIATKENKLFQLRIHANAVCQVLPKIASQQYFSKNGADPVRPLHATNWPDGVGIKIRDKTGEILGVKNGFTTGWMNPNWGGAGHATSDELLPMYSDGLDLSELMEHLTRRLPGELSDATDLSQLEFKLKIFTSTASILRSDGTAVSPGDRNDFESDWISGNYLETKP